MTASRYVYKDTKNVSKKNNIRWHIFLLIVLVPLFFGAKCVNEDGNGGICVFSIKKKDPDIRCISVPGSVMDVNMFHVVSFVF